MQAVVPSDDEAIARALHDAFQEADSVLLLCQGESRMMAPGDEDLRPTLAAAFDVPEERVPRLGQT